MKAINRQKVYQVYSGKSGACCCGCAGKHTYAQSHKAYVTKSHGYTPAADQFNDRVVKSMTTKVLKDPNAVYDNDMVYSDDGKRMRVIYLRD